MPPELTLLSRVGYRGQEITSPRVRSLLALLAEDDVGRGALPVGEGRALQKLGKSYRSDETA
jgi:hypothetical protein